MKVDQKRPTPQRELAAVPPTGGDWSLEYDGSVVIGGQIAFGPGTIGPDNVSPQERKSNCRLMHAAPALYRALCDVEWGGTERDIDGVECSCCPWCGGPEINGHLEGCGLAAALAKATGGAA